MKTRYTLLLAMLTAPFFGWSATIFVSSGGSIQDGIDQAVNGDTVQVGPGTYDESLYILKDIVLVSEVGAYQTLITGGINGSDFAYGQTRTILAMSPCVIDGFFITQASRDVDNNHNSMGILLENTDGVEVRNCLIENHITGIYLSGSSNSVIEDNIIQHCGNGVLFAAHAFNSDNNLIQNNAIKLNGIADETDDAGVKLITNYSGIDNDITGNDIYKNQTGINNLTTNTIMARGNWWGTPSGPQNGINPNGSGNPVSNFVDFGDWSITVINEAVLSIASPASPVEAFKAFPSPARDQVTLEFDLTEPANIRYTIIDFQGRTLAQQSAQNYPAGTHQVSVDLNALSTGLYLLNLETEGASHLLRLVVQK